MKKVCKLKKIIAIIFFSLLAVMTIIFAEIDTHFNPETFTRLALVDNVMQ
ncbi:CapA family protein, partial [Staphylococcus hominis]